MKAKARILLVLLCVTPIAAHADTTTINFFALIGPGGVVNNFPPNDIVPFEGFITNPGTNTIFLSDLIDTGALPIAAGIPSAPTIASAGGACFAFDFAPETAATTCNSSGELPLVPGATALYSFGALGTLGMAPGIYTDTLFVYGGFAGSNDFSLLGEDTLTFTVVPVPEPSTLLLLGTGLLAIVALARRKRVVAPPGT